MHEMHLNKQQQFQINLSTWYDTFAGIKIGKIYFYKTWYIIHHEQTLNVVYESQINTRHSFSQAVAKLFKRKVFCENDHVWSD